MEYSTRDHRGNSPDFQGDHGSHLDIGCRKLEGLDWDGGMDGDLSIPQITGW